MLDYLLKTKEITILDMMIVAVAASIIAPVTMYIAVWILKRIWHFISTQYKKVRESYRARKRLKNGNLSVNQFVELRKKEKEGTLTKLEEEGLRIADQRMKKKSKEMQAHLKEKHPNLPTLEELIPFRKKDD